MCAGIDPTLLGTRLSLPKREIFSKPKKCKDFKTWTEPDKTWTKTPNPEVKNYWKSYSNKHFLEQTLVNLHPNLKNLHKPIETKHYNAVIRDQTSTQRILNLNSLLLFHAFFAKLPKIVPDFPSPKLSPLNFQKAAAPLKIAKKWGRGSGHRQRVRHLWGHARDEFNKCYLLKDKIRNVVDQIYEKPLIYFIKNQRLLLASSIIIIVLTKNYVRNRQQQKIWHKCR